MNKVLIYLLVVVTLISSCRKDDKSVFSQSPDDRLNATLAKYQTQLSGAQYGWKGIIYPAGGGAYSFYFRFNDSNRVKMYSDFDTVTAVTLKESSYRLKAIQQPSLIFDTYSYVHLLCDPNEFTDAVYANVNGGILGGGLVSDFEFYFDSVSADTINLVGRYNRSKAILIRATSQEATAYNSGQLGAGFLVNRLLTYFKRLTIGTQMLDVNISPSTHTFTFTYLDATGVVRTVTTSYYLIAGGIVFTNPVVIGSITIAGFSNMQWIATTQTISMTVNNVASTITGVVVPIRVDVGAPKRWRDYALSNSVPYWFSGDGFHVNGVDDAYNINSLTAGTSTFYYLIYWPLFRPNYDFVAPAFEDAQGGLVPLTYGIAARTPPIFTADGRAIFVRLGDVPPYPATGPAALTKAKLTEPGGYYFVQTGANTYDMVNATDGRSWITWETF